jgi:hypothetical protein
MGRSVWLDGPVAAMAYSDEKRTPYFSIQEGKKWFGCLRSVFMEIQAVTGYSAER